MGYWIYGDMKVIVRYKLIYEPYLRIFATMYKLGVTLFATIGILTSATQAKEIERPNILVIMVDDLGYADSSSYGATDLKTPSIDSIVNDGIKFTNFYANCPVCSPSRASFVSGRYPELVGVPGVVRTYPQDSWGYLSKDIVTIGDILRDGGYSTALIGKWHLGLTSEHWPNNRGFDYFHGWLGDMMDDYYKHERHGINYMRLNEEPIHPQGHATDLFTSWACDYLDARAKENTPFFLFLSYNAPHTPIQPPIEWLYKVRQRAPEMEAPRARLVALIEHLDRAIGVILENLDKNNQTQNTVVVFTSDNGGQLNVGGRNGDYRDGKQSMYEGGIRVNTALRWPRMIKPGTVTHQRGLTMDLYPTLCEIAGVDIQHELDGISLAPVLRGEKQDNYDRDLYIHRREGNLRYQGYVTNALIRGDWKLLRNSPFAKMELYNLKDDPYEMRNLAQENPGKFNELSKSLRLQLQRGGAVPWQPPVRSDVNP